MGRRRKRKGWYGGKMGKVAEHWQAEELQPQQACMGWREYGHGGEMEVSR